MNIDVIDITGKKVSEITLNEKIWGITPHSQAQFDSLLSYNASLRQGTHKVKTRAEVSGGGRKPWRQKGTGNARQGSIRSPQWKGGGIVFGPTTERNYLLNLSKKVRRLALKSALAAKLANNKIVVLEQLTLEKPSTKTMANTLKNLDLAQNKTLVINENSNEATITNVLKSGRNITKTKFINVSGMNIFTLLNANKVCLTVNAIKNIEEVLS